MMKFSELKTMARQFQSGAKASAVDNDILEIILRKGVEEVNRYAKLLKKNKKFDLVADTQSYLISDIADDFVTMDKERVKILDSSTSTQYRPLYPRTDAFFDDKFAYWRDATSSRPTYYSQEENELNLYPAHAESITDGGWLFYIRKPEPMQDGDDYPFHILNDKTVPVPGLSGFDYAILLYFKWKTAPVLSKEGQQDENETAFFREIDRQMMLYNRRADLKSDKSRPAIRPPRIRSWKHGG